MCKYVYTYACVCVYLSLCSWTFICLHIYACVIDSESGHTSPKESWMSPRQMRSEGPEPQKAVKCKARPNPGPGGAAAGRTPLISRALRQDLPSRCSGRCGALRRWQGGGEAEWVRECGAFYRVLCGGWQRASGIRKGKKRKRGWRQMLLHGEGGGWVVVCLYVYGCVCVWVVLYMADRWI